MTKKVLVVDDDVGSGKAMMWAMEAMGHEVQLFQDGPTAIAAIEEFTPDVVLCDIKMPAMSGYEVCQTMKADERLQRTIFIAQTGLTSPESKKKATEAGFAHYMVKPVDINALLELVYLEIAKAPEKAVKPAAKKKPQAQPVNTLPRVLVIEDYAPNVLVVTTCLEDYGYSYDVATNGIEGLEKAKNGDYLAILMDVQMPELDGYETTKMIREYERQKRKSPSYIIAMTAHALVGDKERCIEAGMNDYLPKAFTSTHLQEKLATLTPAEMAG